MRKILSVFLSVLLLISISVPSYASENSEQVKPRMILTQTLSFSPIQKIGTNRCWAACGAAIVNYLRGYAYIDQYDFQLSATDNINDVKGTIDDVKTGLSAYGISYTSVESTLTMSQIMSQIDAGKPIFAQIGNNAYAHALVIIGYYYNDNPYTTTLYYMEPDTGTIESLSYASFCNHPTYPRWWSASLYNIS